MSGTSNKKYTLDARLGGGGMAEVFRGSVVGAEGFTRTVAIKRVLPSFSSDDRFAKMFVNEARISSFLSHQNIVSTLDFDRDDDGALFLVMELVEGPDMARLIETGALPRGLACYLTIEILRGLGFAHELCREGKHLNIVHRDISPHNVLLSWEGAVKVSDFGIAKAFAATEATDSGVLKGKAAYMSPEQASAASLDGRSDLFAVGAMLYELLTGRRLFSGNTVAETFAQMLAMPIVPPSTVRADVPADLDAVVMRLLARDRDARFPSAHDAIWELQRCNDAAPRAGCNKDDLIVLLRERFPEDAPLNQSVRLRAHHLRTPGSRAVSATPGAMPGYRGPEQTPSTKIGTPATTIPPQHGLNAATPGRPLMPASAPGTTPAPPSAPAVAAAPPPPITKPLAPVGLLEAGRVLGPDRPTIRAEGLVLAGLTTNPTADNGHGPPAAVPVGTPVDTPADTAARSLELAAMGRGPARTVRLEPKSAGDRLAAVAASATSASPLPATKSRVPLVLGALGALAAAIILIVVMTGNRGGGAPVASLGAGDGGVAAESTDAAVVTNLPAPRTDPSGAMAAVPIGPPNGSGAGAPVAKPGDPSAPIPGGTPVVPASGTTTGKPAAKPAETAADRPDGGSDETSAANRDNGSSHDKPEEITRPKGRGALTVIAVPWATVYVDGKRVGTTPVTITVEAGTRKVVLENDDVPAKKTFRVNVPAGGKKTLEHTW